MAGTPRWRRLLEPVLSIGAYAGEPETKRGGRRVVVVAFIVATLLSIPIAFADLAAGYTWVAAMNFVTIALTALLVVAIRLKPHAFAALVTAMFVVIFATQLVETAMFGGLLASGLVVIFSLVFVLGSLVAIGLKAATWWFAAFAVSVVYAVVIPDWVDPIYELSDPSGDAAFNLIATGIITLAVLAYFVRQRDRFQARSDDLLHNILPDEIVGRLKAGSTMIADDFTSASVLFADVVGFTPMSAKLSRPNWWVCWMRSSRRSTGSSPSSGWRRSRRWATPTWSPLGSLEPGPIMRKPSPISRSGSEITSRRTRSKAILSPFGSASTLAR